uniref:Uncharacterized protein n=1 Tax=Timema tahoe TaxID=61484 RepID=A0A7R9IBT4_9NEOP|nr:unnamed protein product [Timema tahoe]
MSTDSIDKLYKLFGILADAKDKIGEEKHKSKVNVVGMRDIRNVCGQTHMDRVSNEWVRFEIEFNMSM